MTIYEKVWSDLDNYLAVYYDVEVAKQIDFESMLRRINLNKTYFTLVETYLIEINKEAGQKELLKAIEMLFEMWQTAQEVITFSTTADKPLETRFFLFGMFKYRSKGYKPAKVLYGLGTSVSLTTRKAAPNPMTITKAMDATMELIPFSTVDFNDSSRSLFF